MSSQTGFEVTAKFCRGFSIEDAVLSFLFLLPVIEGLGSGGGRIGRLLVCLKGKQECKQKQKDHVYAVWSRIFTENLGESHDE